MTGVRAHTTHAFVSAGACINGAVMRPLKQASRLCGGGGDEEREITRERERYCREGSRKVQAMYSSEKR